MNKRTIFYETAIRAAVDGLQRTPFISVIRLWRKLQWRRSDELAALQASKLSELLSHAVNNIPYYSRLRGSGKASTPALYDMPVLTKDLLRRYANDLMLPSTGRLVQEMSSGSSGIQSVVFMSRREHIETMALQTFVWEWSGYRIGDPMLQTGMSLPRSWKKSAKDTLLRTLYVPAYDLTDSRMDEVLDLALRRRIQFIGGYASSLNAYACRAMNRGKLFTLRGAISWGDKLFSHYRTNLETAFKCQVTDVYGATEGVVIAGQCEKGSYHLLTPHVMVEIVDESYKPVPRGESGRLLVTRLDAYSMPLIRYDIGDIAAFPESDVACSCGRGFPVIQSLIGRDTDVITTRSGKRMIVHFFTAIFEHIPAIQQFQVIKRKNDRLTIRYIPRDEFTDDTLEYVRGRIVKHLGEHIEVDFERVVEIAASPSGKPQLIVHEQRADDQQ